jgi:ligand-binding SRPBCC domain-containing protein
MPAFRMVTEVDAPVERCFHLARSIDLHLESMIASGERAVAGVTSGLIGAGEEVSWEARHFGVRWRMTARVTSYEPPHRFVDEMVRGPFRSFRHEHLFEPAGAGTRMTDLVTFRMALRTGRRATGGALPAPAPTDPGRGHPVGGHNVWRWRLPRLTSSPATT